MNDATFDKCVLAARKRVNRMDKIDGFAERNLRTILFALEAGLRQPDSEAQWDALVMLDDVVNQRLDAKRDGA